MTAPKKYCACGCRKAVLSPLASYVPGHYNRMQIRAGLAERKLQPEAIEYAALVEAAMAQRRAYLEGEKARQLASQPEEPLVVEPIAEAETPASADTPPCTIPPKLPSDYHSGEVTEAFTCSYRDALLKFAPGKIHVDHLLYQHLRAHQLIIWEQ